jgi:predicted AAA+ superfamily ATPase
MEYKKRVIDTLIERNMEAFGATLIKGPKGCGKTTSAKQKANTVIEFQNEDERENLLRIANTMPSKLLSGKKPILFDEWQDAPKIWGAIRKEIDDSGDVGLFLLTGSTSEHVDVPHTGTLRISQLDMYPMSLYESEESNGSVSLRSLFEDPGGFDGCISDMKLDDIIFAICRGGWPSALNRRTESARLMIARSLYRQTYASDISNVDGVSRNPKVAQAILQSYSRNLCTMAETKTIIGDVRANYEISDSTFFSYFQALEKLYIIDDVEAWCPAIRSKSVIRASKKRNFVDPSIAVAALGLSPGYFEKDFKTLGFLFESLCIRDLKVYSSEYDGRMSYYRDRYGLEADGVLHLNDGRCALIEFKLGESEIEEGAKHLNTIESLVRKYNETERQCPLRIPDLKLIITGTKYGYRRDDGVFVIPVGCLKD